MKKTIAKKHVNKFLARLLKDYAVYAPTQVAHYVSLREITSPEEVVWDCLVTREPAKGVFFPQTEVLFRYQSTKDGVDLQPTETVERPRILWGIRSCDAQALLIQEAVFDTPDARDVYYVNKREKTTLVGIGCNEPLSTCFCTAVGGDPFKKQGLDLLLTDIGDAYLVEAMTDKGKKLLAGDYFQKATRTDVKAAKAVEKAALARLPEPMDVEAIKQQLDQMIDSPLWDKVHATCLGCGVCTLLCPVCYCFDIVDEGTVARGERVRNWDTCQYCVYTLEASGHNPRATERERVRQRLMHKFDYQLVNQGMIGCVGCGRCVQLCPVNLDIRQTLAEIGSV
jgi:sulfhydrogenase subunit beta (sulfur reductase)